MLRLLKIAVDWINDGITRLMMPEFIPVPKRYRTNFAKAVPNNWTWKHGLIYWLTFGVVISVPWVFVFWIIPSEWWSHWREGLIALFILWKGAFFVLLMAVVRRRGRANFCKYIQSWNNDRAPICFACNYDLRGTTGTQCPECGGEILTASMLIFPATDDTAESMSTR